MACFASGVTSASLTYLYCGCRMQTSGMKMIAQGTSNNGKSDKAGWCRFVELRLNILAGTGKPPSSSVVNHCGGRNRPRSEDAGMTVVLYMP